MMQRQIYICCSLYDLIQCCVVMMYFSIETSNVFAARFGGDSPRTHVQSRAGFFLGEICGSGRAKLKSGSHCLRHALYLDEHWQGSLQQQGGRFLGVSTHSEAWWGQSAVLRQDGRCLLASPHKDKAVLLHYPERSPILSQ